MSVLGKGMYEQAKRIVNWTLATWVMGRIFDGFEARLLEALREEEEMSCKSDRCGATRELVEDSTVTLNCGRTRGHYSLDNPHEDFVHAVKWHEPTSIEPHECNAACEALLPHPDLPTSDEEIGPSLRMALKNRAEIEAREMPQYRWIPAPQRDPADVAELNRLRAVEADLLNERERARKQATECNNRVDYWEQRYNTVSAEVDSLHKECASAWADAGVQRLRAEVNYARSEALAKSLDCGADGNDSCQKPKPTDPAAPQWEHACAACWWARAIDFRDERDSVRKERDELQEAKNKLAEQLYAMKGSDEARITKLESFLHQQVLDRLKALEVVVAEACDDTSIAERLATLEQFMSDVKAGRTW